MNYKKTLNVILGVLAGNVCLALAVTCFILPHGLIMGGATGLALTANYFLQMNLSTVIFIINILLFLMGAFFLGKKFALTTVVSTAVYPVLLSVFQSIPQLENLTDDVLLSTIYAGLLLGVGIGIIIRMGSSTGGTDILALIIHKKLHIPIAICIYGLDFVTLASQIGFSNGEQILYGILNLLLTSIILNQITLFGKSQIQLMIISRKYAEIREALLQELDAGVTMINIETGYKRHSQQGVMCVISNRKLYSIKEKIQEIDKEAFITVTHINEVRGRGFTLNR